MPGGMVISSLVIAFVLFILTIVFGFGNILTGTAGTVIKVILCIATLFAAAVFIWMLSLYRAFSYNGKRKMSKQIIEGIAERVELPIGGKCLDVGCGSGALTIACAKRNSYASFTGIDRWGKEYASFSKTLCENNAKAEGVSNVAFAKGDATSLDFPDESFDAVTSNYVYHNIPSRDRQEILLETLRVLKKGGSFAIHDIFSKMKYGDMEAFVKKLKNMGYENVEFIDTTNGMFMSSSEAKWLGLSGSALLVGRK
jgi:ubiquinone/menaquinone biosynthesis C-methylase UbiE